jgi:hypothetical protein
MRRLFTASVICFLLAAAPSAASAKPSCVARPADPITATISGPGLSEPLRLGTRRTSLVLHFTGVSLCPEAQRTTEPPDSNLLGPWYEVRYMAGEDSLVQDLYPYAPIGAWSYTPGFQELQTYVRPQARWWRSVDLANRLTDWGLPRSAPSSPGRSLSPWLVLGVVSLMVLLVAVRTIYRRGLNSN